MSEMATGFPDLTGARALTLINPWAHLIIHNGKRVENRTWLPASTQLLPDLFLLHAGKSWDLDTADRYEVGKTQVTSSAIVAVVELVGVCRDSLYATRSLRCRCDNEWAVPGQYHWQLGQVWPLPNPVACRGAQGLWLPPDHITTAVVFDLQQATPC